MGEIFKLPRLFVKYTWCLIRNKVHSCLLVPPHVKYLILISDGADIRRYPISDHIRLYLGYPNPTFYSQIHIRTYPNPTFSDFWVNFMQIFGYPNELFDFFGYPNPTFLLFRLSDPIRIRHFTIRKYSYPTFLVSAPSLKSLHI